MTTIAILTIIGYLTAALLLWLSGSQTDAPPRYRLPAFSTASLAMIANAALIYQNAYLEHVMGLNMSVFNALSAIFWLSSLILSPGTRISPVTAPPG